jgi:hypothetical protein
MLRKHIFVFLFALSAIVEPLGNPFQGHGRLATLLRRASSPSFPCVSRPSVFLRVLALFAAMFIRVGNQDCAVSEALSGRA